MFLPLWALYFVLFFVELPVKTRDALLLSYTPALFIFYCWTMSCWVAQAGLEPVFLLFQSPEYLSSYFKDIKRRLWYFFTVLKLYTVKKVRIIGYTIRISWLIGTWNRMVRKRELMLSGRISLAFGSVCGIGGDSKEECKIQSSDR